MRTCRQFSLDTSPEVVQASPDEKLIAIGSSRLVGENWTGRVDIFNVHFLLLLLPSDYMYVNHCSQPSSGVLVDGVETGSGVADLVWLSE